MDRSRFAGEFKAYINSQNKPEMDQLWKIFRSELFQALKNGHIRPPVCSSSNEIYKA